MGCNCSDTLQVLLHTSVHLCMHTHKCISKYSHVRTTHIHLPYMYLHFCPYLPLYSSTHISAPTYAYYTDVSTTYTVHIHIHTYAFTYTYTWACTCIQNHMHIQKYNTYTYLHLHQCKHIYLCICFACTRMRIYIYTCIHTFVCICEYL